MANTQIGFRCGRLPSCLRGHLPTPSSLGLPPEYLCLRFTRAGRMME